MNEKETVTATAAYTPRGRAPSEILPPGTPAKIGRYRVERLIGEGGFGLVYLAYDDQLDRQVAIKVPHALLVADPTDAESYLAEARTVANLDHPNIVPVHDVGSTPDIPCFVVAKYIDGPDLARRLRQSRLTIEESVKLIATVAEALHHAHRQGLVHRDVKPSNILLDRNGNPFVVDFGLALREQEFGTGPCYAGTATYMSPEQARGEGHRVDARSDIFSLGIVLYQLLVGQRPFRGETEEEILEQIVNQEPRPPRQYDEHVSKDLERICLKALAKRASERYSTAQDMADDLRHYLAVLAARKTPRTGASADRSESPETPGPAAPDASGSPGASGSSGQSSALAVVPKGLRSFDEHDADFFLELLPGPRDRHGLPDSIRFWKARVEEVDADKTFPVGLIYGPSGCGKSSQMKAGLLPRLADHVIPVYLEATPEETESRLLKGLRRHCPALPDKVTLKRAIALLRRGYGMPLGKKVLIVLDQFEQWLHARHDDEQAELLQALRQCDGGQVQCIVMVRDDFWMAATRFMRQLEIPLVEGHNSAAVDLFPRAHAEKVLASFGRAFGSLPERSSETNDDARQFLAQAVSGLAEDGKVICVRLALFSEMMKGRPWKPATLREVGGAEGVGVTFLESTFSSASASAEHRYHERAARTVLKVLLPESGADIKGQMRSHAELLAASGCAGRLNDFDDLLRILDGELRLIVPTDPEGTGDDDHSSKDRKAGQRYYQLSHDYLVPSLRDWLTRKQKETRRGRAELRLADRAAIWTARKESRHLPATWEYLSFLLLTRRRNWSEPQRQMMRAATRRELSLWSTAAALACILLAIGWQLRRQNLDRQRGLEGRVLVQRVLDSETAEVPDLLPELEPFRSLVSPQLEAAAAQTPATSKQRLHASLALLPADSEQKTFLQQRLLRSTPQEVAVVREALGQGSADFFWQALEGDRLSDDERFRAAAALAELASGDARWSAVASFVAGSLIKQEAGSVNAWIDVLRPVGSRLIEPLCALFGDARRSSLERSHAAVALAEFASGDLPRLTRLLLESDARQFAALLPKLKLNSAEAIRILEQEVAAAPEDDPNTGPGPPLSEAGREAAAARRANAAIALAQLGQIDGLWALLVHRADPRLRTYLLHRLQPLGIDSRLLIDRLRVEQDATVRQALLLALSRFEPSSLPVEPRTAVLDEATKLYAADFDPGVHAAAEFLLRRWRHLDESRTERAKIKPDLPQRAPGWYVDQHGHTLVTVPGPVTFQMGALPDEKGNYPPNEPKHTRRIGRSFAVSAKEVTMEQFLRYDAGHPFSPDYSPEPACPVNNVSWYDAAKYCRWLSEEEGVDDDQMCYPPRAEIKEGMRLPADYLSRTGYRLPTEAEWEYVCRAGAATGRFFGESEDLLAEYAWTFANSRTRYPEQIDSRYCARPVGTLLPNNLGMFDVLGNAMEWCQENYRPYPVSADGRPTEDVEDTDVLANDQRRPLRGGSYLYQPSDARAPHRDHHPVATRQPYVGFRVARTLSN